jgi:hypothetical protein
LLLRNTGAVGIAMAMIGGGASAASTETGKSDIGCKTEFASWGFTTGLGDSTHMVSSTGSEDSTDTEATSGRTTEVTTQTTTMPGG